MTAGALPEDLALVPVEHIHPAPLQPRTSVSVVLVQQLADSMRAGRHQALLDVEPSPSRKGHYQIVCGEQRWRAAREAGVERVLVRVHEHLDHVSRLRKQHEENCLRADLTPADDAFLVLSMKTLKDIDAAERLLVEASVRFEPLASKRIQDRTELAGHLDSLKALLTEQRINVRHLSAWRETEGVLGISEAARKRKLSVLRLEPEILADANALPANHAPLIAQVEDRERRAELVEQAPYLTNRQLQAAVRRLRRDRSITVDEALAKPPEAAADPLAFDTQLSLLADLCRQVVRLVGNLWPRAPEAERDHARSLLTSLVHALREFEEAGRG